MPLSLKGTKKNVILMNTCHAELDSASFCVADPDRHRDDSIISVTQMLRRGESASFRTVQIPKQVRDDIII